MPPPGGVRGPTLPKGLGATTTVGTEDGIEIVRTHLSSWSAPTGPVRGVRIETAVLTRVTLQDAEWQRPDWQDVRCELSDLASAEWSEATLTRVEFNDCRMVGARWTSARLFDVRFAACQLDLAAFWSAQCKRAIFERCSLREADFHGADLRGVRFVDCAMSKVNFEGAMLDGADVSSSDIGGARLGIAQLKGLIVSREQAVALAMVSGLVVLENARA